MMYLIVVENIWNIWKIFFADIRNILFSNIWRQLVAAIGSGAAAPPHLGCVREEDVFQVCSQRRCLLGVFAKRCLLGVFTK